MNITIDNTNLTAIHYYPPLCNGTGWQQSDHPLAINNTYSYCHGSYHSRAVLRFTGVAVYYSCPLFATRESMYFHLDDRPFEEVVLTSPTGESEKSQVMWSATNLENKEHTVELLPGYYDDGYGFVSIDAFIITQGNQSNGSESKSSVNPIAVGVGVGLGVAVLLLIGVGAWLFLNRRKNAKPTPIEPHSQPFLVPSPSDTPAPPTSMYSNVPSSYDPSANALDPAMALYSAPPASMTQYGGHPANQTPTSSGTPIYV